MVAIEQDEPARWPAIAVPGLLPIKPLIVAVMQSGVAFDHH